MSAEADAIQAWSPLARGMVARAVSRLPWLKSWREDLLQEALLAVVRCVRGFAGASSFYTYVRRAIATAIWRAARAFSVVASGYGRERECFDRGELEEFEWAALPDASAPDAVSWAHDARIVRALLIQKRRLAGSPNPERDVDAYLAVTFGDDVLREAAERVGVRVQTIHQQNRKVAAALVSVASALKAKAA